MKKALAILFCICFTMVFLQTAFARDAYKIGVLAAKGAEPVREEIQPTADYLAAQTGKQFIVVPLKYRSVEPAIKSGQIDFFLSNPSLFLKMRNQYELKPLASMVGLFEGKPVNGFGAVIFTKADSDINTLMDLKGKKVAANQRTALMGYQVQIFVLQNKGIDPKKDIKIFFAGKLPLVVDAVANGVADVGFVRTGLLQWLEKQGKIKVSDFKVIEPESDNFPYLHNGPILPFWIIGAQKDLDAALGEAVATALKAIKSDMALAKAAHIYGWKDPEDLSPISKILESIQK